MFTVACTPPLNVDRATEICDGWVSIRMADNTSNRDNGPKVSERKEVTKIFPGISTGQRVKRERIPSQEAELQIHE